MNHFSPRRRALLSGIAALGASSLLLSGCERHRYIPAKKDLDLGPVSELLYRQVYRRNAGVILFRNADGWRGLSARCSYRGCDLTLQEPVLLCPCCKTRFGMDGVPYKGWPATRPLPWVKLFYKDGHLYANAGIPVSPDWHFTTPEIEEAIAKLRKRIKEEKLRDEVEIPQVLRGKGDGEFGMMFLEEDPNLVDDLKMIK